MLIDCDTCRVRGVSCSDCVVSLLFTTPERRPDLTESETAAFAALAGGGLLPPLRLVPVRREPAQSPARPKPRRNRPGTAPGPAARAG